MKCIRPRGHLYRVRKERLGRERWKVVEVSVRETREPSVGGRKLRKMRRELN